MPREKESYRDNLERIVTRFPNKELLNKKEVAEFIGYDVRYVNKYFEFLPCGKISLASLARQMSS